MIRPIDIRLNAAHPELKLPEAVTYTGSPSTVLIRGVPPNYGRWAITAVFAAASFPDGSTTTRAAVQSANGVWVATLPATATSGRTENGFRVIADGIDENGEAVTGYIVAVADFAVASLGVAPAPAPGETSWQMLYFDATPATPRKGDVTRIDGDLKFHNGTEWLPFTDLSNYYTAEQVDEAIDKLAAYYITYNAAGAAFPTRAALFNAQTYYSGGVERTPTRNDYAVVLADETHDGAEWRYIYAVPDGETVGQWEPQYPIETNDYEALSNKPQINGVPLSGNKTASQLGLVNRGELRYTLHPVAIDTTGAVSATLADLSVNEVTATADVTSITFTFPPRQPGKVRDFFVRLVIQGTTVPTLYFNEPNGGGAVAFDADSGNWADIEPGVNILMFTDTAE